MTYGHAHCTAGERNLESAVVSHLAELVRGTFYLTGMKAPHPPLRGTFSPRGERTLWLARRH
jgi:hypothetical protein